MRRKPKPTGVTARQNAPNKQNLCVSIVGLHGKAWPIPRPKNFGCKVRLNINKETDNVQKEGNRLGMSLKQSLFSQVEV